MFVILWEYIYINDILKHREILFVILLLEYKIQKPNLNHFTTHTSILVDNKDDNHMPDIHA